METGLAPFQVQVEELSQWRGRSRRDNFFELALIQEGRGEQWVNSTRAAYGPGSLFLLPAANCHTYRIMERSRFVFIRFAADYFTTRGEGLIDFGKWFDRLHYIIGGYNREAGELILDSTDKAYALQLLDLVLAEWARKDEHSSLILQSALATVLEIIARSINRKEHWEERFEDRKFIDLVTYIQYHLLEPERITLPALAEEFHIASTYFSEYFKRNAGETFQDFVLKAKLRSAEAKAMYTDRSFKDIAYDLGFTDSSHLNKMMKRYYGRGMRELRKRRVG